MRALLVALRAALVAVVALLLVGLTLAPSGEEAGKIFRTSLNGQPVRLAMPTGNKPKGLVLWFHGQGGGVNAHSSDPFLKSLYRDGWAVATSDFHLASWGNAASTDDTERLQAWAEQEAGIPVTLWAAGSMGGTVSLNALNFADVALPKCWYGVHPAISLNQMDSVPGAPRFIQEAYDGDPPVARNPVRNVSRLPDSVRYRLVASLDDKLVPYDQNATPLIHGLHIRGIDITTKIAVGGHEDPSHFDSGDLLEFANSCLTDSTSSRASE